MKTKKQFHVLFSAVCSGLLLIAAAHAGDDEAPNSQLDPLPPSEQEQAQESNSSKANELRQELPQIIVAKKDEPKSEEECMKIKECAAELKEKKPVPVYLNLGVGGQLQLNTGASATFQLGVDSASPTAPFGFKMEDPRVKFKASAALGATASDPNVTAFPKGSVQLGMSGTHPGFLPGVAKMQTGWHFTVDRDLAMQREYRGVGGVQTGFIFGDQKKLFPTYIDVAGVARAGLMKQSKDKWPYPFVDVGFIVNGKLCIPTKGEKYATCFNLEALTTSGVSIFATGEMKAGPSFEWEINEDKKAPIRKIGINVNGNAGGNYSHDGVKGIYGGDAALVIQ